MRPTRNASRRYQAASPPTAHTPSLPPAPGAPTALLAKGPLPEPGEAAVDWEIGPAEPAGVAGAAGAAGAAVEPQPYAAEGSTLAEGAMHYLTGAVQYLTGAVTRDAVPESASAPVVSGPAERPGEEGITIRSTFLD